MHAPPQKAAGGVGRPGELSRRRQRYPHVVRHVGSDLPGSELVAEGLLDLEAGLRTVAALVVSIGAPRLCALGFEVPSPIDDAEHALFLLLAESDPDAA